jgi:YidC/Oxa1 family membrane protein insertase
VTKLFSPLMAVIYGAISAILLFWHAAWHKVFGDGAWLGTNWSWVLAIIFLVLTVRAILFPIFVKQIKSQRAMQALQPKVKELQEKHKGDREAMQKALMELYRTEKANPLMGCLPMFLQIPVFLGLFHVLRHLKPTMPEKLKTLYGWNVTLFDSASHAKLFGAPIAGSFRSSAEQLSLLHAHTTNVRIVAGILVLTMIVSTFFTSRQMILKTGWAEDPQQKMVQRLMLYGVPFSLLISGFAFPLGVVLYWTTQNIFSLGQQMWVLRKYPPPNAKGTAAKQTGAKAGAKGDVKKNGDAAKAVAPKALGPKVGAKPINPKKGGAAKR